MVTIATSRRWRLSSRLATSRGMGQWGLSVGVVLLGLLIGFALFYPFASTATGSEMTSAVLAPPSASHWMGTDEYGRDLLVRVALAMRLDYLLAVIGVGVSLVVGTGLGVLVGSARHQLWGNILMRLTDALIAVPFVLLVLLIVLSVGPSWRPFGLPDGVPGIMLAILITGWTVYARLGRTEAAALAEQDFVVGARLMGYSKPRIVFGHILPNAYQSSLTYALSDCVLTISLIGGLAFIGAGVTQPTPELGAMMYGGRAVLSTSPWVTAFPAFMLIMTAIAVTMITSGLLAKRETR
jgi:peptide/nickel transport system permease protein